MSPADVTLSVTMSRALRESEPFGEYWGSGPIAASYWVIAPSGDYIVVKAANKSRAARVVGNYHSHQGTRLCSCSRIAPVRDYSQTQNRPE